jgi:hypothetical protein
MIHRNLGATRHPRRCNDTNGNGKEEEENSHGWSLKCLLKSFSRVFFTNSLALIVSCMLKVILFVLILDSQKLTRAVWPSKYLPAFQLLQETWWDAAFFCITNVHTSLRHSNVISHQKAVTVSTKHPCWTVFCSLACSATAAVSDCFPLKLLRKAVT